MKNILEMSLPDGGVELYEKLVNACDGTTAITTSVAAYNLLLEATMQAKVCDELEAVEDIIQTGYELIELIEATQN